MHEEATRQEERRTKTNAIKQREKKIRCVDDNPYFFLKPCKKYVWVLSCRKIIFLDGWVVVSR